MLTLLDPPIVTVRFRPGKGPPFDAATATQAMASLPGASWTRLQTLFPGIEILPRVRLSPTQLQNLLVRARQLTQTYLPARFTEMFHIRLPATSAWQQGSPDPQDPLRGRQLADLMRATLPIDRVTVHIVRAELAVDDTTDAGVAGPLMGHLEAAPKGVGVEAVWSLPGGKGQGEILTDVERDWHKEHAEFIAGGASMPLVTVEVPSNQLIVGDLANDIEAAKHGTWSLSVAVARKNGAYGIGVAPEAAKAFLASTFDPADVDKISDAEDIADAISRALVELIKEPPGSVMMLEHELSADPFVPDADVVSFTGVFGPCEMDPDVFDYIQLAVALHVIVVEAAGNGRSDKQLSLDGAPDPDVLQPGDSGAILVGASKWDETTVPGAPHHVAISPCTIGDRIDCFAWGSSVYAASILPSMDGLKYLDYRTAAFAGTSAATAIIAGVALVVQGLKRNHGTYLPPLQMRLLLGDRTAPANNTPIEDPPGTPVTNRIGVMPNLGAIARPDLYIRDNLMDDGSFHDGTLSASPDIIVRTTPLVLSPDAEFGELSGTEDNDDLSESPVHGDKAEVYVRVRNRGGQNVAKAVVTAYWADSGVILQPPSWHPIGQTEVDVPADDTIVVAGPIAWDPVDAEGHNCFIATVEHAQDPLVKPATLGGTWDDFKAFVRANNNVASRNFDVVKLADPMTMAAMETEVGGPEEGEDDEAELRVESNLPREATLSISLPEALAAHMSIAHLSFDHETIEGKRRVRCKLVPGGISRLGLVRFKRRERHRVRLHVDVPKALRKRSYEIALIQLYRGTPLGRFTWRLVPKKQDS